MVVPSVNALQITCMDSPKESPEVSAMMTVAAHMVYARDTFLKENQMMMTIAAITPNNCNEPTSVL